MSGNAVFFDRLEPEIKFPERVNSKYKQQLLHKQQEQKYKQLYKLERAEYFAMQNNLKRLFG